MKYVAKKLLTVLFTLILTSFVVFLAFELISGDPAVSKLGTGATPEAVAALREEMGLNRPFFVRYFSWFFGLFRGDFGNSYAYGMPVSQLVLSKVPINLFLSVISLVIVIVISVPIGILTAKYEGHMIDRIIGVTNQIGMAIPPFLMGILLTYLFGMVLQFFAPGSYVSYDVNFGKFLGYLLCPALALAIPKCAMTIKLLRNTILSEAKADYVRTAYSRGNDTNGILYRHVLKNAMMPTITFIGMLFADMIASGIIIEQVFGIPGLGRILLSSISTRDYPVVQAIVMLIVTGVMFTGFLVDLIYRKTDPRVRTEA